MSKEVDHGHYQEFTRTPEEDRIVQDRKVLKDILVRLGNLEDSVNKINEALSKLTNDNK